MLNWKILLNHDAYGALPFHVNAPINMYSDNGHLLIYERNKSTGTVRMVWHSGAPQEASTVSGGAWSLTETVDEYKIELKVSTNLYAYLYYHKTGQYSINDINWKSKYEITHTANNLIQIFVYYLPSLEVAVQEALVRTDQSNTVWRDNIDKWTTGTAFEVKARTYVDGRISTNYGTIIQNEIDTKITTANIPSQISTAITDANIAGLVSTAITDADIPAEVSAAITADIPLQVSTAITDADIPAEVSTAITDAGIATLVSTAITNANIPAEVSTAITNAGIATLVSTAITDADIPTEVSTAITNADIPTEVSTAITNADIPTEVSTAITNANIATLVLNELNQSLVDNFIAVAISEQDIPTQVSDAISGVILFGEEDPGSDQKPDGTIYVKVGE